MRTFTATPLCAPLAHYYCVPPVLAHLYPIIHTPLFYQDTPHFLQQLWAKPFKNLFIGILIKFALTQYLFTMEKKRKQHSLTPYLWNECVKVFLRKISMLFQYRKINPYLIRWAVKHISVHCKCMILLKRLYPFNDSKNKKCKINY